VAPQPAVLRMELACRDERFATLLGCLLTLTPGTMALDYRPGSGLMYIHALDARDAATIKAGVREIERRLLRWLDAGPPPATRHDPGRRNT
jgi:multicomponent Na+:H+ antiporter subunit E